MSAIRRVIYVATALVPYSSFPGLMIPWERAPLANNPPNNYASARLEQIKLCLSRESIIFSPCDDRVTPGYVASDTLRSVLGPRSVNLWSLAPSSSGAIVNYSASRNFQYSLAMRDLEMSIAHAVKEGSDQPDSSPTIDYGLVRIDWDEIPTHENDLVAFARALGDNLRSAHRLLADWTRPEEDAPQTNLIKTRGVCSPIEFKSKDLGFKKDQVGVQTRGFVAINAPKGAISVKSRGIVHEEMLIDSNSLTDCQVTITPVITLGKFVAIHTGYKSPQTVARKIDWYGCLALASEMTRRGNLRSPYVLKRNVKPSNKPRTQDLFAIEALTLRPLNPDYNHYRLGGTRGARESSSRDQIFEREVPIFSHSDETTRIPDSAWDAFARNFDPPLPTHSELEGLADLVSATMDDGSTPSDDWGSEMLMHPEHRAYAVAITEWLVAGNDEGIVEIINRSDLRTGHLILTQTELEGTITLADHIPSPRSIEIPPNILRVLRAAALALQ